MGRSKRQIFILFIAPLLLVGCSNTKPYRAELPNNLKISTKVESVKATLDIYEVDKLCKASYQGTIALNNKTVNIGIPPGKLSYISVGFASSSFLGGTSSYTSQGTLLTPRKGYQYMVDANYVDGIYNVMLFEKRKGSAKRREVAMKGLSSCVK